MISAFSNAYAHIRRRHTSLVWRGKSTCDRSHICPTLDPTYATFPHSVHTLIPQQLALGIYMARSGTSHRRERNPQATVPGTVLSKLIKRAATEGGPDKHKLKDLAQKAKRKNLKCDVPTAVTLIDYARGQYHGCSQSKCNNRLVLWEAISGMVSCLNHRTQFKLGSRKKRLREREAAAEAREGSQVRSY